MKPYCHVVAVLAVAIEKVRSLAPIQEAENSIALTVNTLVMALRNDYGFS